jgi:hypothetical protein
MKTEVVVRRYRHSKTAKFVVRIPGPAGNRIVLPPPTLCVFEAVTPMPVFRPIAPRRAFAYDKAGDFWAVQHGEVVSENGTDAGVNSPRALLAMN